MAAIFQRAPLFGSDDSEALPQRVGGAEVADVNMSCHGGDIPAWVRAVPPTKLASSPRNVVKPNPPELNRGGEGRRFLSNSLLTVAEAASFFQVSEKTIRRMIARGELPIVRIGRSVRIRQEVIEKIVRQYE